MGVGVMSFLPLPFIMKTKITVEPPPPLDLYLFLIAKIMLHGLLTHPSPELHLQRRLGRL